MDMDKDGNIDMVDVKAWFTSKTVWVAILTVAGGIVEYLVGLPIGVSIGTVLLGIINILLRFSTNQPIK